MPALPASCCDDDNDSNPTHTLCPVVAESDNELTPASTPSLQAQSGLTTLPRGARSESKSEALGNREKNLFSEHARNTLPTPITPDSRYVQDDTSASGSAAQSQDSVDNDDDKPPRYYGQEITDFTIMITDNMKYSGIGIIESLDYTLLIYDSVFDRLNPPREVYSRAFPTILTGLALDYYYNNGLQRFPVLEACEILKKFFEGPTFNRRNMDMWNAITLQSVIAENPGKPTRESLQIMIIRLQKLQFGLLPVCRTPYFLHTKIVSACTGIPSCRYAIVDPPEGFHDLINKLYSSIMSYEEEQEMTQGQSQRPGRRQ